MPESMLTFDSSRPIHGGADGLFLWMDVPLRDVHVAMTSEVGAVSAILSRVVRCHGDVRWQCPTIHRTQCCTQAVFAGYLNVTTGLVEPVGTWGKAPTGGPHCSCFLWLPRTAFKR